ncbi:hypothetical protein D3C71_1291730 [compost metagenome]
MQFRPLFEKLGYTIEWIDYTQEIKATKGDTILLLKINSTLAEVNGRRTGLEQPPKLINSNTMVPLRFISEMSGKEVRWDDKTRTIDILKGYEEVAVSNPYGGDSFLKLDDIKDHPGVTPNIYSKDGYVYVTWYKETSFSADKYNFKGYDFYMSVARNGSWLERGKKYYSVSNIASNVVNVKYLDGSYYLMDDASIRKLTPNKDASYVVENYTYSLPHSANQAHSFHPFYIGDEVGIIYATTVKVDNFSTSYLRLYYKDGSQYKYDDIKDAYGILSSSASKSTFVYNPSTKIMAILGSDGYRQLDVVTGDLLYDKEGKDLILQVNPNVRIGTTRWVKTEGGFGTFYQDNTKNTIIYSFVTNRLNTTDSAYTTLTNDNLGGKTSTVTVEKDKITLWSLYEFNRKPSINFMQFKK